MSNSGHDWTKTGKADRFARRVVARCRFSIALLPRGMQAFNGAQSGSHLLLQSGLISLQPGGLQIRSLQLLDGR
jgi:hypothetical protein